MYRLNKDYSKEQVALQKLGPTMELTKQLSKDEMWMNKAFMHHFYIDDISNNKKSKKIELKIFIN